MAENSFQYYMILYLQKMHLSSTGMSRNVEEWHIPSINKGKSVYRHASLALFALFALAGVSQPAAQKAKALEYPLSTGANSFAGAEMCSGDKKLPGMLARFQGLCGSMSESMDSTSLK